MEGQMVALQIKIPVDRNDNEVTVTLDPTELQKALAGEKGGACVVIGREEGSPLHVRAPLQRVAA
jgi:hypothetical protein